MPRVPDYEGFQVAQNNIPNARASIPAPRSFTGDQLQNAGQGITRAGEGLASGVHNFDVARVNDAANKAMGAVTNLTYDQTNGYTQLRGEAALNRPDGRALPDEYGDKLTEKFSDIAGGLGNDNQRRLFKQQSDQMLAEFRRRVAGHMAQEANTYNVGVHDGTVAVAAQRMSLGWEDPATVSQSADAIRAATYEKGKLLGWSPVQTQAATSAVISPAHLSVIQGAVDAGKADYATEYLKNVQGDLTPAVQESARKLVDAGNLVARTQTMSEDILAKHPDDPTAAIAEARSTSTGKEQDALVERIKARFDEVTQLREKAQKDAADTAWKTYAQTHDIRSVPLSILNTMDGRDAEALRKTARADANARRSGVEVATDSNVYYTLTQAAAYDPNFIKEDLRNYFDRLSPSDRAHFINLQATLAKKDDTEQVVGTTEQINAMSKALGLKGADAGVFTTQAVKSLLEARQQKGSPLSQDERQKVLDRMIVPGTVPGNWFGTASRRLYQAREDGKPFTPEFSDADKRKMADAFKRRGIANPTPAQIDAALRKMYGAQ